MVVNIRQLEERINELKKEIEHLNWVLAIPRSKKKVVGRIAQAKLEISHLEWVIETPNNSGTGRPLGSTEYSIEMLKFLRECEEKEMGDKAIINEFNIKFKKHISLKSRALHNLMVRQGIRKQTYWRKDFIPKSPETVEKIREGNKTRVRINAKEVEWPKR